MSLGTQNFIIFSLNPWLKRHTLKSLCFLKNPFFLSEHPSFWLKLWTPHFPDCVQLFFNQLTRNFSLLLMYYLYLRKNKLRKHVKIYPLIVKQYTCHQGHMNIIFNWNTIMFSQPFLKTNTLSIIGTNLGSYVWKNPEKMLMCGRKFRRITKKDCFAFWMKSRPIVSRIVKKFLNL